MIGPVVSSLFDAGYVLDTSIAERGRVVSTAPARRRCLRG